MAHPNMIIPVVLHMDDRTPVDDLRHRYAELLEASEDWDRVQEPRLEIIDAAEDTLQVRVLCSAKDASTAWDLHCHLREELVAFLRDWDDGRYLPRSRMRIEGMDGMRSRTLADVRTRTRLDVGGVPRVSVHCRTIDGAVRGGRRRPHRRRARPRSQGPTFRRSRRAA